MRKLTEAQILLKMKNGETFELEDNVAVDESEKAGNRKKALMHIQKAADYLQGLGDPKSKTHASMLRTAVSQLK